MTHMFWPGRHPEPSTLISSDVLCLYALYFCLSLHLPVSLQVVNSAIVPDSYGALGLLAVPINVLREQELERVSGYKYEGLLINPMQCFLE